MDPVSFHGRTPARLVLAGPGDAPAGSRVYGI